MCPRDRISAGAPTKTQKIFLKCVFSFLESLIGNVTYVPILYTKTVFVRLTTSVPEPVLRIRIRIHRIHMFLGLQDPDPLVRGMDPDPALDPDPNPSINMQKQ
jgi:hypothetical protein